MKIAHPFTEIPDDRWDYQVFEFEHDGIALRMTTTPDTGYGQQTLIASRDNRKPADFVILSFSGHLSVDAVVEILRQRDLRFRDGCDVGRAQARRKMREALGL